MKVHFSFSSNAFSPLPDEDQELINEGTYGKSLILWHSDTIGDLGYSAGDLIPEDFGWYRFLKNDSSKLGVACSVIHDEAKGEQECHLTIETCGILANLFKPNHLKEDFNKLSEFTQKVLSDRSDIWNLQIDKT